MEWVKAPWTYISMVSCEVVDLCIRDQLALGEGVEAPNWSDLLNSTKLNIKLGTTWLPESVAVPGEAADPRVSDQLALGEGKVT